MGKDTLRQRLLEFTHFLQILTSSFTSEIPLLCLTKPCIIGRWSSFYPTIIFGGRGWHDVSAELLVYHVALFSSPYSSPSWSVQWTVSLFLSPLCLRMLSSFSFHQPKF